MSIPIVSSQPDQLPAKATQAAVRRAFEQMAAGRAVQPLQVVTDIPGGGDVIAYQAVLADEGVYAVKVSPYLPQAEGSAIVTAWTLLLSLRTGEPLLLIDSKALTAERTAATTALAVDLLARPDARRLAVIGLGQVGQGSSAPRAGGARLRRHPGVGAERHALGRRRRTGARQRRPPSRAPTLCCCAPPPQSR
ncbi:MAG: hypothetical protein V9E82_06090 [Candidatus Nanopelagicales bacterium]